MEFCPKNRVQTVRMNLKMVKYFQGLKTVDEHANEFYKIINCARYIEGPHIILKFCQGLNVTIQDHVACMTADHPSDNALKEWYAAALLCNENCIANEAFRGSLWRTLHHETSLSTGNIFHWLPVRAANMIPPIL
jgi:hypothetical protein